MQLSNILTLPSHYKDRQKNVDSVSISNFVLDKDLFICSCISNRKYTTKIYFLDNTIIPTSTVQVDCTCSSFNFEFSYAVGLSNGLIYPDKYLDLSAKKKNIYSHLSACKHIITLAQFIHHRSVIINNAWNKQKEK